MIIPTLAEALCLFMSSVKPNLVLLVKPKGAASSAIEIRRRGGMGQLFKRSNSAEVDDHTGFSEIIPAVDAQKTIRELGAIINDIQKLGDYAIDKWKE